MGIFSNILDTAKNVVGKVTSGVSNFLNTPTSGKYQASNTLNAFNTGTPDLPSFLNISSPAILTPRTTQNLSKQIQSNPIVGAANSGGTIRSATLPTSYSLNQQSNPLQQNYDPSGIGQMGLTSNQITGKTPLPATPTAQPVNNYGFDQYQAGRGTQYGQSVSQPTSNRGAIRSVAPPGYQYSGGKLVPLPQGATGTAGITSDFSSYFGTGGVTTPSTLGGSAGVGGGMSNFLEITGTGNIGSVGGPILSEEEKKGVTTKTEPTLHTPLITSLFGALNPPKPEPPLDTTVPPEISTDTSGTETYSGAANMDENTLDQQISDAVSYKVEQLNTVNPVPDNAVVDTQEQIDFLNQFPPQEQYDIRSQMDQIKLDNGYSEYVKQKADAQNTLAAINEEYTKVIDDIKANPDLPKALAQRRIDAVMEKYKFAQMQVMAVMEQAQTQMDAIDALVAQEFQIANFEESQRNRQEDNARQMASMIIESGAIAGYSDSELQNLADQLGLPVSGLKRIKQSIIKSDELEYKQALADLEGATTGGASSTGGASDLVSAIMENPTLFDTLTPSGKQSVIPELQAQGFDFAQSAVPLEVQKNFGTVIDGLDSVLEKWSSVPNKYKGQVQGRLAAATGAAERNAIVADFNSAKKVVGQQLTRLFEKGVISDSDREFYQNLMPNLKQNSYEIAEASANSLKDQLNAQITQKYKAAETGVIEPTDADSNYLNSLGF